MAETPSAEDLAALQGAIDAAVASAVAATKGPLEAQLADLQAKLGTNETDAAVAAATAGLQGQLDSLTTELGAANARIQAFETEKAAFDTAVTELQAAEAKADELKEISDARKAVLVAKLEDQGLGWDEARADARIEALAGYSEDQWTVFLDEQRATAAAFAASAGGAPTPAPAPAPLPGAGILGGGAPQAGAEATAGATPPAPANAGETTPVTEVDVLRGRAKLAKMPR